MTRIATAAIVVCFALGQAAHNGLRFAVEDDAAFALDSFLAEHSIAACAVAVELLDRKLAVLQCHVALRCVALCVVYSKQEKAAQALSACAATYFLGFDSCLNVRLLCFVSVCHVLHQRLLGCLSGSLCFLCFVLRNLFRNQLCQHRFAHFALEEHALIAAQRNISQRRQLQRAPALACVLGRVLCDICAQRRLRCFVCEVRVALQVQHSVQLAHLSGQVHQLDVRVARVAKHEHTRVHIVCKARLDDAVKSGNASDGVGFIGHGISPLCPCCLCSSSSSLFRACQLLF